MVSYCEEKILAEVFCEKVDQLTLPQLFKSKTLGVQENMSQTWVQFTGKHSQTHFKDLAVPSLGRFIKLASQIKNSRLIPGHIDLSDAGTPALLQKLFTHLDQAAVFASTLDSIVK